MNISMIFFFASFVGIIAMIWLKSFELKTDKKVGFSLFAHKTDHKVHAVAGSVRTFFSYFNRKSAVALLQWIAYHVLSWARSFYIHLHKKAHAHPPSKKVIDMVRGRVNIDTEGGASFYLKKISHDNVSVIK